MLRRAWIWLLAMAILPQGAREAVAVPADVATQAAEVPAPTAKPAAAGAGAETKPSANPLEVPFFAEEALKPAIPETLKIDYQGGSTLTADGAEIQGPLKVTGDKGQEIFANRARWVPKDEMLILEGQVTAYLPDAVYHGEHAVFYYERDYLDTSGMTASAGGILLESGKFRMEQRKSGPVFVGEDAGVTFHDVEHPHFWLRAKQTTVYPGDRVSFKNLKLYAGEVPVFWVPYLSQPLDSDLGYHFMPGMKSTWGAYLLNSYGTMLGGTPDPDTGEREDAWLLSKWRLDLMSQRGAGVGVDFQDIRTKFSPDITGLSLYYINDLDPDTSRTGVPRGFVNEDRWSLELKQRQPVPIPDGADWRVDSNISLLSDRHFLEDFRPDVYRNNPEPDNTFGLFRRDQTSLTSLYARFQGNDFYQVGTRLPELAFDQARRPLFGTRVLHEGSTSLGWLGLAQDEAVRNEVMDPLLRLAPGDPRADALLDRLPPVERQVAVALRALPPGDARAAALRQQLVNTGFTRFHTYQDFSLPLTVGDLLQLTPMGGIGYTSYMDVDGAADDESRFHLQAGVEASVKFSKVFDAVRSHSWGLNGLRHVLQPYASLSVLSSDDLETLYPRVDRLTFSTRPPPLSPERFTATDDLASWNILRLGARNHLLTRRDGYAHEWAFMDTYIDSYHNDPEMDRRFSNLYNDIRLIPVPWLSCGLETQFPLLEGGSGFNEVATYVQTRPTPNSEVTLGYRWLDNHPVLTDSNRVDLRTYLRLSENWGVGTRHTFEMDDGTLEYQNYSLHRDMGSWVAAVGLLIRDNRLEEEYGVMFSVSLKDLPSFSLPLRMDL